MSENRNRNSSSLLDPFLATGGVIPYGAGLGVLTVNPAAKGRYVVYYGSNGQPVKISALVLEAIKKAGMPLEVVPRQAPQLVPGQSGYAPHPPHLRGNSAVLAEANELRARHGSRVSSIRMGLSGPGLSKNMQPIPNGQGRVQIDLDYLRWNPLSGTTHFRDELKGRNEISGREQARQTALHGKIIAAHKALTRNARLAGRALQAGGPALQLGGVLLDYHLTQQEVQRHLAQGDTHGAGLANARLFGRQTGGVLGSAAAGAMLLGGAGAIGGSAVAPGPGTLLLGTAGVLGGGLFGSIFGEEAVRRLYEQWMGTPASGSSRTLGTPASQPTTDSFYPPSGPAP
ncbi:MAG: hypothetical protein ABIL01_13985 [Pseudomonadota bacterium]